MRILDLIIIFFVLVYMITACTTSEPQAVDSAALAQSTSGSEQDQSTETPLPSPTDTRVPTEVPTDTPSPTATVTENPIDKPEVVTDAFLDCHSDKDRPINMAAPEEKGPSESSVVG